MYGELANDWTDETTRHAGRDTMNSTSKSPKRDRLEALMPHLLKQRLERAAALEGLRLSEFVTLHLAEAADNAIQMHEMMTLTEEDTVLFVQSVLNPPEPNQALLDAAERSRQLTGG
jgi:uncharacterized protein (DUF1778 family)